MSKARILVVEDEVIIAMEIENSLLNLGYEVISVVDNGDKAIQKAEEDKPDLIIMDIRIKGDKDGIETAEVIRNNFEIPVVFSTAYLDESRIERAKITMPFGYILKPLQERDLKITLEMALYVSKVDKERKKNEARLSALLELYQYKAAGIKEILDFALEKCLTLTESELSFLGYISEDEKSMYIHAWSKSTMTQCEVVDKPIHFNIDEAGIWAEAVRKRKPTIVKDYSKDHPSKKGMPDGHVSLSNILTVPIFEDEKIVMIVAVSNRVGVYSNADISQLRLLMEGVWQISKRKKTEYNLNKIEWLLEKSLKQNEELTYRPYYGDVTALNSYQLIKGSIDFEVLRSIASDTIDLLETSVAIYEKNGDYAFGMFSSGWCQLMDSASRKLCHTDDNQVALSCGKWLCHENCWNDSAKVCIDSGKPTDIECIGGLYLYGEPIIANKEVVGAINIGYGNPPTDDEALKELSDRFSIPIADLRQAAEEYDTRPKYIIDLAKKRLKTSAQLIGKMVESAILQKKLQS